MRENLIYHNSLTLKTDINKAISVMHPYQKDAVKWLLKNQRGALVSGTGSGKTLMLLTMTAIRLYSTPTEVSILILCSKNAIHTWVKEIKKWYPSIDKMPTYTFHNLKPAEREKLWLNRVGIFICTYATFRNDYMKHIVNKTIHIVLKDEAHRGGIRNHKSKTFECFKKLQKHCTIQIWTTATDSSKGAMNIYPTANLAQPLKFRSYYQFMSKYCIINETPFGREVIGVQDPEKFAYDLRDVRYRVPQNVIDAQRPAFAREVRYIDMTKSQKKLYCELDETQILVAEDAMTLTPNEMSKTMRQRQLLCTPRILSNTYEIGACVEAIIDFITDCEDSHTVIFVPFIKAIPTYKEALVKVSDSIYILQGGMSPEQIAATVQAWKSTRGLMICSIQFAESFELETARYMLFAGFHPDPDVNLQAEGRVMRNTTKHPVTAYYIIHKNTYESDQLQALMTEKFKESSRINNAAEKIRKI